METRIKNSEAIIAEFMKWMESRKYSIATKKYYRLHIEHFLRYLPYQEPDIKDLKQIDRALIQRYRKLLAEEPLAYTKASREQREFALKAFFKWLINADVLLGDPTAIVEPTIKRLKLSFRPERDYFTKNEIQKIFAVHDTATDLGRRDRALIEVMYYCGMQPVELSGLLLEQCDMEYKLVKFERICKRAMYFDEAMPAVKDYVERVRDNLKAGKKFPWFLLTDTGWQMTEDEIMAVVQGYVDRAGIKARAKPLTIRNSRVLHMICADETLQGVQWFLGDKDIATTKKMFLELIAANKRLKYVEEHLC